MSWDSFSYDKKLENSHKFLQRFMMVLHHANKCPIWISYSLKIVEEIYNTVQLMWTDMIIEMEKHKYHMNSVQKEKQKTVIEIYHTMTEQLQQVRDRPFYNVLV